MRVEIGDEVKLLSFEREHLLNSKPLQIDLLIIKKKTDERLRKNIGKIFRKHNIIEYKSPTDYLGINDFYKVYGYACIYIGNMEKSGEIPPSEVTITMIANHYPYKMLKQLEKERNMRVEKVGKGIYYLLGDQFPIQLLINKQLSKEENYWLNMLRNDLQPGKEIEELIERYECVKKSKWHTDVMDVIVRGNWKKVEEEKRMCDALREMFQPELEEARQMGKTQGITQGRAYDIIELLNMCGEVPDVVKEKILTEKDEDVLIQWLKKAAKVESIQEFEAYISKH